MSTRERSRPSSSSRSSRASGRTSDASFSPLDDAELNDFTDAELDHLLDSPAGSSPDRFGRIATATGIGMMLVLAFYLIAEFTSMGFLSSSLGIGLVGMMMAIIGFGVFSGRKKKPTTTSKDASKRDEASVEEQVEAKLREARAALDAEEADASSSSSDLRRSMNKKLFGVCAGLAEYFDIDITLVRAAFLVGLVLSGGQLMLVYFGLAYIMPKPDDA
ncbi:MAG: PspC domain-containing protein [Bacteroidota bacterium]